MSVSATVCFVKGIWIDEYVQPKNLDDDAYDEFFDSDEIIVDGMCGEYTVLGKIIRHDVDYGFSKQPLYFDDDDVFGSDQEVFESITKFMNKYPEFKDFYPKSVDDIKVFSFTHYS